jgi:tRNA 2-selenouridine synthase SelU
MKPVKMHIPQDLGELLELISSMMLSAPTFADLSGYLPFLNLDYVFQELHEGLSHNRRRLGEERYHELVRISDEMRTLFEADPENKTGQALEGYKRIRAMEDILKAAMRKS